MQLDLLSERDFGWVVGMLEGEGCFGAYQDKRRPDTWTVKIQMESTDLDVVERFNKLVPGRVWESVYPSRALRCPRVKRSWRWAISNKAECEELGRALHLYMSRRRQEQIEFMLSHSNYVRKPK